jgi:hypothetical protein
VNLVDIVLMQGRQARGIAGATGRTADLAADLTADLTAARTRGYVAGQSETHDDPTRTRRYPGEGDK